MTQPSLLLYLHGFNSSPQSHKANVMKRYCDQFRPDIKFICPQLPCYPQQASEFIEQLVLQYQSEYKIGLVGSSLGGYLSTWLNHRFGLKAVLVNPAVKPFELLQDFLGEQINPYTQQRYVLQEQHIQELRELWVESVSQPRDFWLLQQTGDEVLDYRQAVNKYRDCKQNVEQGGDHSFVDFERYPAQIIKFLEL